MKEKITFKEFANDLFNTYTHERENKNAYVHAGRDFFERNDRIPVTHYDLIRESDYARIVDDIAELLQRNGRERIYYQKYFLDAEITHGDFVITDMYLDDPKIKVYEGRSARDERLHLVADIGTGYALNKKTREDYVIKCKLSVKSDEFYAKYDKFELKSMLKYKLIKY